MIQEFLDLSGKQRFKIWNTITQECKQSENWFCFHSYEEIVERYNELNVQRSDVPMMDSSELEQWLQFHYRDLSPADVDYLHSWKDGTGPNPADKPAIEASNALLSKRIRELKKAL